MISRSFIATVLLLIPGTAQAQSYGSAEAARILRGPDPRAELRNELRKVELSKTPEGRALLAKWAEQKKRQDEQQVADKAAMEAKKVLAKEADKRRKYAKNHRSAMVAKNHPPLPTKSKKTTPPGQ